jgi:hypothetical protein
MALIQSLDESNLANVARETETANQIAELAQMLKPSENLVVKGISKHIDKVWQQNKEDNKQVRIEMVKNFRRIRGEYEPAKLSSIRAFKGSEVFIRLSENKCRAADSWVKDIYRGDHDLPFDIQPTEISDLPDETIDQITQEVHAKGQQMMQELMASGVQANPAEISRLMNDWHQEALDKAKEDIQKEAKERCKRAALLIRDQNQEGGWADAFKEFLWYFIRTKAGIIKGPILTKKAKTQWQPNADGTGFEITTVDVLVNDVYCVSPFNFYPSKNMRKPTDGNIIEIHELTKQAISSLRGVPGYNSTEIDAVLTKYASGDLKAKWFTIDDETAVKQVEREKNLSNNPNMAVQLNQTSNETIFAQEFYGTISGKLLIEWGAEGTIDANTQYQANCWKIGDHVIKAVINPDSLGRKPYHVSSWAKNPAWIWGEGLVEFAEPIEDIINSITRALQNNIAIASGPQVEVNVDRCDDKSPLYPWKRWLSTSMQMKDGPAVQFWQPQMHSAELISAWQFFSKVLDEMTVPAYAQGASQSGVTAGTATVFTQLLAAASRSIKAVVANIDDDIITPYIQMCYDFNMKFGTDETMKGDARAVARGVSGLLAKEQQAQRKVEFLQVVANPIFAQILGQKNLGAILADIAKSNDISLPDHERLDGDMSAQMQLDQMIMSMAGAQPGGPNQTDGQAGSGGTPTEPQGTNPDGSVAGQIN